MLGGWQGTFCAGISTHNIERGVWGVDYVVNVRSFAVSSLIVATATKMINHIWIITVYSVASFLNDRTRKELSFPVPILRLNMTNSPYLTFIYS